MRKKGKVILSTILAVIIAVTSYPMDISAARVEKMSVEDISKVVGSFTVGNQVTAVEEGYYEFSVPSNGKLQIQESSRSLDGYGYHIYTGINKEIVGGVKDKYWIRLSAGTYYVYMRSNDSLTLSFTDESSGNYEKEKNDSFDLANEVQVNQTYIGNSQISCDGDYKDWGYDDDGLINSYYCGDEDYYHFSINQKGIIYIDFSQIHNQYDEGHALELYQEDSVGNLTTILSEEILINNGTTTRIRASAGSYYFKVYSSRSYGSSANLQDYSFQLCYKNYI